MSRAVTISRAKALRQQMTLVELRMWEELRARNLGVKFRRQHPIGPYIADFACVAAKLIVELDGDTHIEAYDDERDRWMEARGWRVMRVVLHEVDSDIQSIVESIKLELAEPNTMLTYWQRMGQDVPDSAWHRNFGLLTRPS